MRDLRIYVRDLVRWRDVTDYVSSPRFTITAPGGFEGATFTVRLPRSTFGPLGPAGRVRFDDARTARTVWEGFPTNPGTTTSDDGESFEMVCLGTTVLARDESRSLIYLDTLLDRWVRDPIVPNAPSATAEISTDPLVGGAVLLCQFNPGQPVGNTSRAQLAYRGLVETGQELAAIKFNWVAGITDSDYRVQSSIGEEPTYLVIASNASTTLAGGTPTRELGPDFAVGSDIVSVRLYRNSGGPTNVPNDDTWVAFKDLRVVARRFDRYGTAYTTFAAQGGQTEYVLASQVVEDLIGRGMLRVEASAALIDATAYQIDQLAFTDATNPAGVLDALSEFEPDMLWEILEYLPTGIPRFNYRAWPTEARYILDDRDDFNQEGGEEDLCNRIAVNWTDAEGNPQTTVVTTTVEALGTRIRDAEPVTLPPERSSLTNAQRYGAQVLATKADPPTAATATVGRRILDRLTGQVVLPHEIRPGYCALHMATGELLRITKVDYDGDTDSMALTLGEPLLTEEQVLAKYAKRKAA